MKETNTKKSKVKSPAILSRIVIFFFFVMVILFVNINSLAYTFNRDSYEPVSATVMRATTDPFLLLIPQVEIRYSYDGQEYTEKKFFVLEPLFGLSSEPNTCLTLYVNTKAPNNGIFQVDFYKNILNWIIILLEIACIYNLIQRIRKYKKDKEVMNHDR